MPAARISIVSSLHLCRNPRVWKEASALANAGHDVTLVHVSAHPDYEVVDERMMAGAPFRRLKVDLLGTRPMERLSAFSRRSMIWLARRLNRGIGANLPGALGPGRALRRLTAGTRADLVIVHTEAGAWAGAQLLRRGWNVAADFEDWYSEDLLPEARRSLPLQRLKAIEGELLQKAAYVSAPSEAMADALQRAYGGNHPLALSNSFPLQPEPAPRTANRVPELVWFSQTIGPGRGLELFLAAWSRTPLPAFLTLIGAVTDAYRASLLSTLPASLRARLTFQAPVPADDLPAFLARFDVGLALEQGDPPSRDLTITNKILQYLNAGLAVFASDTAGQREVLEREPAAGVLAPLGDAVAAAAALGRLLEDRRELAIRQAAARRLAERVYRWEREIPRLLAAVDGAVAAGPAAQRPIKRTLRRTLQACVRMALRARSRRYPFTGSPSTLIVAPHDDDASLGCGALIAAKVQSECPVAVVCLTDGGASHPRHPTLAPAALIARRRAEAGDAMAKLGIGPSALTFLDAPDGTLAHLDEAGMERLSDRLAAVLARVRPEEIFVPCRNDGSSEHNAAFLLTGSALSKAGLRPRVLEYLVWAWWDPRRILPILFTGGRIWRVGAAASGDLKRQAVARHATQVEPTPPWMEPVLPRDFVDVLSSGEEFYFERSGGNHGKNTLS